MLEKIKTKFGHVINHSIAITATAAVLLTCPISSTYAADKFINTEIQFLYGDEFQFGSNHPDDTSILTMTLDHFSTWEYGDNYLFFDVAAETNQKGSGNDNTTIYGEYYPRLSLSKLTGKDFSAGIISDVSISAGINVGNGVRIATYGPSLNFNIPGFYFFQLDLYAYNDLVGKADTTYQITPSWAMPFKIGNQDFQFRGFADFIGDTGNGSESQIIAQPQIRWVNGKFFVGMEWWYWKNKFGVDGIDESFPQLLIGFNL